MNLAMTPRKFLHRSLFPFSAASLSLTVLVGVLTCLLTSTAAPAEENEKPANQVGTVARPFTDVIDVRLVQVETVVTDKSGERVHGLGRNDFRVLVDGEVVPLEVFEEVRNGVTVAEGARTTEIAESNEAPETAPPVPRDILVFVDDYFSDRGTRLRLLGNLARNLDTLGPRDRMAIVRYVGWGLEIRSEWTSSQEDLARVIDELRRETPGELIRVSDAAAATDPHFNVMDPKQTDLRISRQIRGVMQAMALAMRAYGDAPGRKLFVPVTLGWRFDPLRGVPNATAHNTAEEPKTFIGALSFAPGAPAGRGSTTRRAEVADVYGRKLLDPLVDTANLLGYTVYPMHLGRPSPSELQRTSLWIAAKETGGRIATEGAASTTPLLPVVADTGSYYVLGFMPERAFDDQRHTVAVEVLRPEGAKVRHRTSFLDLSREVRRAQKIEEKLLLGHPGGDLDVTLGDPRPARRGTVEVPVTVDIPMDWVTLVPQGKKGEQPEQVVGELELLVASVDDEGRRSETTTVPLHMAGPPPPPGSHIAYETTVQLRSGGDQRLVLYLFDQVSGASRLATLELTL
jgi:VWFA-related protein